MMQVTFSEMCKYIFCCKPKPRIESIYSINACYIANIISHSHTEGRDLSYNKEFSSGADNAYFTNA